MDETILVIITLLILLDLAVTAALYIRLCLPDEQERLERRVEAAQERAMEAQRDRGELMDEGFENIMRFSVNGKTGFERD